MKEYQKKAQKKYKNKRYKEDEEFREITLQLNRNWRERNKEKVAQCSANYRKNNREKVNKHFRCYYKEWRNKNIERDLANSAKQRAKRKNIEYTITHEDIIIPETCPVFNQPFVRGDRKWAPSIDRIDNTKGYTKNNIT